MLRRKQGIFAKEGTISRGPCGVKCRVRARLTSAIPAQGGNGAHNP